MDCPGNMNLLCGSDGRTHINECIMNGTACRKRKQINKVQDGSCIPGDFLYIFKRFHKLNEKLIFKQDILFILQQLK